MAKQQHAGPTQPDKMDRGLTGYRPKRRDEIARNMSAIRSTGNRTEVELRRALHALGLRYRTYRHDLPGRPDIVFPTQRVAVFVDGDYWHGRLLAEHGPAALEAKVSRLAEPSRTYWRNKLTRRVDRDRNITTRLNRDGWLVLRFWESDIRPDVAPAAQRIAAAVRRRQRHLAKGPAKPAPTGGGAKKRG